MRGSGKVERVFRFAASFQKLKNKNGLRANFVTHCDRWSVTGNWLRVLFLKGEAAVVLGNGTGRTVDVDAN